MGTAPPPPAQPLKQTLPFPAPVNGVITLAFLPSGDVRYEGVVTANTTFAFTGGGPSPQSMRIRAIQDSIGGHNLNFPGAPGTLWSGGVAPTPRNIAAGQVNVFMIDTTMTANVYDGSF